MELDERLLIELARKGDPQAERALYDGHVDRVYRLAYRMTKDETLAQDYTQDTFIRAFDRLATFRQEAAFSTWLHAITTSVVLNGLRKVKRQYERETDLDIVREEATASAAPDLGLKRTLHRAIDDLSDALRIVFVMHDLEGYKHHEIAEMLSVPVGTSKARLSRAREKLKQVLQTSADVPQTEMP